VQLLKLAAAIFALCVSAAFAGDDHHHGIAPPVDFTKVADFDIVADGEAPVLPGKVE